MNKNKMSIEEKQELIEIFKSIGNVFLCCLLLVLMCIGMTGGFL